MNVARDAHERPEVAAPAIGKLLDLADDARAIDRDAARFADAREPVGERLARKAARRVEGLGLFRPAAVPARSAISMRA